MVVVTLILTSTNVKISTDEARDLPPGSAEHIERLARRIYRTLDLTGYARKSKGS